MLLLFSCGETEQIGDKLSDSEIEYLRQRAARKCINETNDDYADYISDSADTMFDYERNQNEWDFTYKVEGTVTKTHKIYVWKQTTSAVYFRIVTDDTPAKHIYLKFSRTANNDLMRSVQEDDCAQGDYEASASSSSVSLRQDDENFTTIDADSKYKYFRTYAFTSSLPAFFGNLKLTLKKETYNDDEVVTATKTDSYEITADTTPTAQPSTDYADNNFYGASNALRYYCLITSANPVGTATYRRYTVTPIDISSLTGNITCVTGSDTNDVTLGTESFDPDGELIAPF